MGWSEEVHQSRVSNALREARIDLRLKRKGLENDNMETASLGPFAALVGAAVSLIVLHSNKKKIQSIRWKELPVLKQFHQLIYGTGSSKAGSKSAARAANAGKAAASPNKGGNKQRPKVVLPAAPAKVPTPNFAAIPTSSVPKPAMKPATATPVSETLNRRSSLTSPTSTSGGGAPPAPEPVIEEGGAATSKKKQKKGAK
mmetsp:Transcript_5451/g.12074  ORF Transcript_5451/g.12074 Transcript_5451/m.12074 type:complete len:200 (+) Transcript_5451:166-765(+)